MRFTVWGAVRGKPRPRFSTIGGHVRAYTTKAQHEYERLIASEFVRQGGRRLSGAISVRIDTYRALPKSRPKRISSESDTFKPDADNICKSCLDALNGVAWDDDAQVVELCVVKHPRTRTDERMTITIEEVAYAEPLRD